HRTPGVHGRTSGPRPPARTHHGQPGPSGHRHRLGPLEGPAADRADAAGARARTRAPRGGRSALPNGREGASGTRAAHERRTSAGRAHRGSRVPRPRPRAPATVEGSTIVGRAGGHTRSIWTPARAEGPGARDHRRETAGEGVPRGARSVTPSAGAAFRNPLPRARTIRTGARDLEPRGGASDESAR